MFLACMLISMPPAALANGFSGQLNLNGQTLYLNGQGPRKKAFLTVYDAALYLTEKGSDARAIIAADHPMAISLIIRSRFTNSERISQAFHDGLLKSTDSQIEPIQAQTELFLSAFEDGVVKNDAFQFVYTPGEGTTIYTNGVVGAPIEGLDFKQALFGIWLSETPVAMKLKAQLLGN